MKYQIVHESIKEYQPDVPKISLAEISDVVDNSIEHINIYHILETVEDPESVIKTLVSKLRTKGFASAIGIDVNKLCELYLDNLVPLDNFTNLVKNKTNLYTVSKLFELLQSNGASIITAKTDRLLYYIEFGRQNDKN